VLGIRACERQWIGPAQQKWINCAQRRRLRPRPPFGSSPAALPFALVRSRSLTLMPFFFAFGLVFFVAITLIRSRSAVRATEVGSGARPPGDPQFLPKRRPLCKLRLSRQHQAFDDFLRQRHPGLRHTKRLKKLMSLLLKKNILLAKPVDSAFQPSGQG
jgi:hypothetical protein